MTRKTPKPSKVTDEEKRALARKWASGWRPAVWSNRIFGCSICRKSCIGFGNRAAPVNDGECCDDCNANVVIPARFKHMRIAMATERMEVE